MRQARITVTFAPDGRTYMYLLNVPRDTSEAGFDEFLARVITQSEHAGPRVADESEGAGVRVDVYPYNRWYVYRLSVPRDVDAQTFADYRARVIAQGVEWAEPYNVIPPRPARQEAPRPNVVEMKRQEETGRPSWWAAYGAPRAARVLQKQEQRRNAERLPDVGRTLRELDDTRQQERIEAHERQWWQKEWSSDRYPLGVELSPELFDALKEARAAAAWDAGEDAAPRLMPRVRRRRAARAASNVCGDIVKAWRERSGLTQDAFAQAVSMPRATLWRYEAGRFSPRTRNLMRLVDAAHRMGDMEAWDALRDAIAADMLKPPTPEVAAILTGGRQAGLRKWRAVR